MFIFNSVVFLQIYKKKFEGSKFFCAQNLKVRSSNFELPKKMIYPLFTPNKNNNFAKQIL